MSEVSLIFAKYLLHSIKNTLLACLVVSLLLRILLLKCGEGRASLKHLSLLQACLHLFVIVVIEPPVKP